jgi:hypothetical protein
MLNVFNDIEGRVGRSGDLALDFQRFQLPGHVVLHQNRPPNSRSKATAVALIGENTSEQRSTDVRWKALTLLGISNDGEQGRTV